MEQRISCIVWRILRIWARFNRGHRRRSWVYRQQSLNQLRASLRKLGLDDLSTPGIRTAFRTWRYPAGSTLIAVLSVWLLSKVIGLVARLIHDASVKWKFETLERVMKHYFWVLSQGNSPLGVLNLLDFALLVSLGLFTLGVPFIWLAHRWPDYRLRIVQEVILCVRLCARAECAGIGRRPSIVRSLDRSCRQIERLILRSHRTIGSVPRRSTRRTPIKQHAGLVAGVIRQRLQRLDSEPDVAFRELARALTLIAENYSSGRAGALLSDEMLAGVHPVSRFVSAWRESAHVALAIVAAMVAATAASLALPALGVKDDVIPWLTLGFAVLAAVLVAGWRRVSGILGSLPV